MHWLCNRNSLITQPIPQAHRIASLRFRSPPDREVTERFFAISRGPPRKNRRATFSGSNIENVRDRSNFIRRVRASGTVATGSNYPVPNSSIAIFETLRFINAIICSFVLTSKSPMAMFRKFDLHRIWIDTRISSGYSRGTKFVSAEFWQGTR